MSEPLNFSLFEGKKILIVEDASDNLLLIKLYLRTTQAQLFVAVNGREAVTLAQQEAPDIILMDIQMPEMDGYEATAYLRQNGFNKIIIAMTAYAMKEDIQKCLEVGCDNVLVKPFKKAKLLDVILQQLVAKTSDLTSDIVI